jgi:hypothetical protein
MPRATGNSSIACSATRCRAPRALVAIFRLAGVATAHRRAQRRRGRQGSLSPATPRRRRGDGRPGAVPGDVQAGLPTDATVAPGTIAQATAAANNAYRFPAVTELDAYRASSDSRRRRPPGCAFHDAHWRHVYMAGSGADHVPDTASPRVVSARAQCSRVTSHFSARKTRFSVMVSSCSAWYPDPLVQHQGRACDTRSVDQVARRANPGRGQQAAQEHVPVRGEQRPQRPGFIGQPARVRQLIHPVTLTPPPGNLAGAAWEVRGESGGLTAGGHGQAPGDEFRRGQASLQVQGNQMTGRCHAQPR